MSMRTPSTAARYFSPRPSYRCRRRNEVLPTERRRTALRLAARESPRHCTLHDSIHRVPDQPHPAGDGLDARFLQPRDHFRLELGRVPRTPLRPRHLNRDNPVLRALDPRDIADQRGLVAPSVQVPPLAGAGIISPGPTCGVGWCSVYDWEDRHMLVGGAGEGARRAGGAEAIQGGAQDSRRRGGGQDQRISFHSSRQDRMGRAPFCSPRAAIPRTDSAGILRLAGARHAVPLPARVEDSGGSGPVVAESSGGASFTQVRKASDLCLARRPQIRRSRGRLAVRPVPR